MKKILVSIVVLFMFSINAAYAENSDVVLAKKWTQVRGQELLNIFSIKDKNLKYKKLDDAFTKYVDVEFVAKFSLGRFYRELSVEQRKIYYDLFYRYCLASYKKLPLSFASQIDFDVISAKEEAKSYAVSANIKLPADLVKSDSANSDLTVWFYLNKNNDNFLIKDIKVADASFLLSFRNKFSKMVFDSDGEIDWFLDDFETLIDRIESGL